MSEEKKTRGRPRKNIQKSEVLIEKQNDSRNHLGRFTTSSNAIPKKEYRNFLQELLNSYGNVPIQYVLDNYQKLIDEYNAQFDTNYEVDTSEPIGGYDSQIMDVLDEIFKANSGNLDVFSMLKFDNMSELSNMQNLLKEKYPYPWVDWTPTEDFHITLVYSMNATPKEARIVATFVNEVDPVDIITIDGANVFPPNEGTDGKYCLVLTIMKSPELSALQEKLYRMSKALMISVSNYSIPDSWTPHITLGYSEEPIGDDVLKYVGGFSLRPTRIDVAVDREVIGTSLKKTGNPSQTSL